MSATSNTSAPPRKNARSKKIAWMLAVILALLVGLHFFVYDFMVPRTASLALPFKWRRIPLRQNKETVRAYFGEPQPSADPSRDEWLNGVRDKQYVLNIYYINDTAAASFSIHYRFDKWFSSRDYLVDTGTIR